MSLDARILYLPRNFRSPRSEIRFDLGPSFSCCSNCFVVSVVLCCTALFAAQVCHSLIIVLSVCHIALPPRAEVKSDGGNVCRPKSYMNEYVHVYLVANNNVLGLRIQYRDTLGYTVF